MQAGRRRIVSILVLITLLAGLAALLGNRISALPAPKALVRHLIGPPAETAVPRELEVVRDRRRLPPDARFVRAAEILVELLDGERSVIAEVHDEGAAWRVRLDSGHVLRVPDLADLGPLVNALTALATELARDGGPAPAGDVTIEELPAAARLLVHWNARTIDGAGVAEEIAARALAALAAARALGGDPLRAEEVLLAYDLGYTAHALRVARDLDPYHPVRAFVEHDRERLAWIATGEGADDLARHLWLRRAGLEGTEEWGAAFTRVGIADGDVAALATGLELSGDDALRVAHGLVVALAEHAGVDPASGDVLGQVYRAIGESETSADGPLRRNLTALHHRALLLSALRRVAEVELDFRAAPKRVNRFLLNLPADRPGELGELSRWIAARLAWVQQRNPGEALQVLASSQLAPHAVIDLAFEVAGELSYADRERRVTAHRIAVRLDARPWHRWLLAELARTQLFDLVAAEAFYASAAETNPQGSPRARLYLASFRGDEEALLQVAENEAVAGRVRADALHLLDDSEPMQQGRVRRVFEALVRSDPSDFGYTERYANHLMDRGEFAASEAVVRRWLEQTDGESEGLARVQAVVLLSRSQRQAGNPEGALRTLEPIRNSQKNSALLERARVLEALGRRDDAIAAAGRAFERYPRGAGSLALLVELLWKKGEDGAAAGLLAADGRSLLSEWRLPRVGKAFANVFSDLPPERAEQAARQLRTKKVRIEVLPRLGSDLAQHGHPEAGFRVASLFRRGGVSGAQLRTRAYRILRDWKGPEAAAEWFVGQTPPGDRVRASWVAFDEGLFDLLWDLVPEPPANPEGDFLWVLRAAAALREDPGSERLELLGTHFAQRFGGERAWYGLLGRVLLGLASEEEAFAAADSAHRRCELYYYLAEKARAEGRYADLVDWYLATIETGQVNTGEFNWALGRLFSWSNAGTTVSRLAAERA